MDQFTIIQIAFAIAFVILAVGSALGKIKPATDKMRFLNVVFGLALMIGVYYTPGFVEWFFPRHDFNLFN